MGEFRLNNDGDTKAGVFKGGSLSYLSRAPTAEPNACFDELSKDMNMQGRVLRRSYLHF